MHQKITGQQKDTQVEMSLVYIGFEKTRNEEVLWNGFGGKIEPDYFSCFFG